MILLPPFCSVKFAPKVASPIVYLPFTSDTFLRLVLKSTVIAPVTIILSSPTVKSFTVASALAAAVAAIVTLSSPPPSVTVPVVIVTASAKSPSTFVEPANKVTPLNATESLKSVAVKAEPPFLSVTWNSFAASVPFASAIL